MLLIAPVGGVLLALTDRIQLYLIAVISVFLMSAIAGNFTKKSLRLLWQRNKAHRTGPAQLICEYYFTHRFSTRTIPRKDVEAGAKSKKSKPDESDGGIPLIIRALRVGPKIVLLTLSPGEGKGDSPATAT